MKALSILVLTLAAAASHAAAAIGIGVVGGGGGTPDPQPISATVYATDEVTFNGTVTNGADLVEIDITTPGNEEVATLTAYPDADGNFSVIWFPPVDSTYTVQAETYLNGTELSKQTIGFVSAIRPDAAGHITGGGWYNYPNGKDTMGFVAQVLSNGSIKGNFEFQDHEGLMNFKSTSLDWVYAPTCTDGYFTGYCKLNGSGNYRFFVHVVDNGEPGTSDSVDFSVYDPNSGALLFSYSKTFSHGNVQIHCK
ncbi:MAG: hypothetical protein JST51_02985 [Armatimonadetes bacterium]|nr:hypothetical protein [Armatimonadota bacterium]